MNRDARRRYSFSVRPIALWRHELRRAGWAALLPPLAVTVLLAVLTVVTGRTGGGSDQLARLLQALLEMGLPLAAGVGAASLVGRDPGVELQLTVRTGYRATLLRRLAVTLGWSAGFAVAATVVMVATGWWSRWPDAHNPLVGQLTWLAPVLWLGGLGFLAGALLRSPAVATGLVTTCWIFEQVLADVVLSHRWSQLLFLYATTRGTGPTEWMLNRLTLVGTGALLLAGGWLLLGRTERLLTAEVSG